MFAIRRLVSFSIAFGSFVFTVSFCLDTGDRDLDLDLDLDRDRDRDCDRDHDFGDLEKVRDFFAFSFSLTFLFAAL